MRKDILIYTLILAVLTALSPLIGSGVQTASVTDACSSGQGNWEPFQIGSPGSTISITANTIYGWEVPANSPLCTVDSLTVFTSGSGNFTVSIWNAAATANLASGTPGVMLASQPTTLSFPAAFQVKNNVTYVITFTGDTTTDLIFVSSQTSSFINGGTAPRAFTCANSAAWSGGVPNLPSACGARSKLGKAPIAVSLFHQ